MEGGFASRALLANPGWESHFSDGREKDKLLTLCPDRNIGKILWRTEITRARSAGLHSLNGPASSSPATDGQNVYVFFQDFGLTAYSADGSELMLVENFR